MCCGMNITEFRPADLERRARISAASEGGRAGHRGGIEEVKTADSIVDMGPEGADAGGEVVAQGTPERSPAIRRATLASTSSRCWRGRVRAGDGRRSEALSWPRVRLLPQQPIGAAEDDDCGGGDPG